MGFAVLFKGNNLLRLFGGLAAALKISLLSVCISLILGTVLGSLMNGRHPVVKGILRGYLEIVRIMPQLVLLFLAYFGTTRVLGVQISAQTASVLVFSFWGTAEMSDLVRGALSGIPPAQYESSLALGLNEAQTLVFVIIPQIVRRMIPLCINLITRMIKTTSLVMMIGIVEILKVGQQIIEANRKTAPNAAFGVYLTVFVLYFAVCCPISRLSRYLEKKWEG